MLLWLVLALPWCGCDLLTKQLPESRDASWMEHVIAPSDSTTAGVGGYVLTLGENGPVPLQSVTGLYLWEADSVIVCDGLAGRFFYYASDGTFSHYLEVARDQDPVPGRLLGFYFTYSQYETCDPDNHRVVRFDRAGRAYGAYSQIPGTVRPIRSPADLIYTPSGWALADWETDTVEFYTFSSYGLDPWHVGRQGQPPTDLKDPVAIAWRAGLLAIADQGNRRVVVCKVQQNHVTKWEAISEYQPGVSFRSPAGVAFGPDGRLYVSDRDGAQVVVLGPDLAYRGSLGVDGAGGSLRAPGLIRVNAEGFVYVCDADRRVVVFGP